MTPELWQRVRRALDRAMEQGPGQRAEFLRELRRSDAEVATELERLLAPQGSPMSVLPLPAHLWDQLEQTILSVRPAAPAAEWPAQIGPFVVEGELARGGMGVVLRVTDPRFDRPLAVKILAIRHGADESWGRRFVEEARVMGQLQHPGIPPVHDLGELPDGRPYLVMKLIHGRTLAELLAERGARTEHGGAAVHDPHWLTIFEQVCQTMAFAHAQGVLHRDLKPANIMVGTFGEVQVMDWGLAKRVARGAGHGVSDEGRSSPAPGARPAPLETQAGSVMGTPAYMAPEQACGDVQALDERCDVFGLGALLCELLTGLPPFVGKDGMDALRLAREADLSDAWVRLARCGADRELIDLARRCLEPDLSVRWRRAGEVAQAVTDYLVSVQMRLRQAEVQRAEAQARAGEEQKRRVVERQKRRVTAAAAAALLLLVAAVGAAGVWYFQDQAVRAAEGAGKKARAEQLAHDLDTAFAEVAGRRRALHERLATVQGAAQLLSDIDAWKTLVTRAREAWRRARALADGGQGLLWDDAGARLSALDQQLQADEQDLQWAVQLDAARLGAAIMFDGKWNPAVAAGEYPPLFARLGLQVEKAEVPLLAEQIGKSRIRHALVAALGDWAVALPAQDHRLLARLLELARAVDPDEWRDQVRDPKNWNDPEALRGLATRIPPERQTPQILVLLAARLAFRGAEPEAANLLRKAVVHHPRDFWLHFVLGTLVPDSPEKAGWFQAALAIRPASYPACAFYNLGVALHDGKDDAGAIVAWHKAIAADPNHARAHYQLGLALKDQGRFAEALRYLRRGNDLGARQPNWNYPSARWLNTCEHLLKLDQQLPAILKGQTRPRDAAELAEFGHLCYRYKKSYGDAVDLYAAAFAAAPKLAEDWETGHRYHAACAAVLAAAGQGNGAARLEQKDRARLRQQALVWLRAELAALTVKRQETPQSAELVRRRLEHWQKDADLAGLRDTRGLARVPEAERKDWQQLWADVAALLPTAHK
jgi:hypothetical protein